MITRVAVIAVVVVALVSLLVWSQRRDEPLKVSGFIEADEIRLGSRVGGRVMKVHVGEGEQVEPGAVLVALDPYDLTATRARAAAELARQRAQLEQLVAGPRPQTIAAAAARLSAAQAQLDLAQLNYNKVSQSFGARAASQDEMDQATQELRSAEANVELRQQELGELKEGTRPEEIAQAKAAVQAAEASLAAIDRQIEELTVEAPIAGRIEAMDLQPGDLVAPNAPMLTMIDTGNLWVRAFVPENRLDLQLGQKVQVTVDSFPDRVFTGHISFIARQGEFTPSNVQTPEERSKQVFRIKVTLDEGLDVLRPGMAADVWLESPAR